MKLTMIEKVFFGAWILCGLSLDCFFDSRANMAYTAVMAIIGLASAFVIYRKEKNGKPCVGKGKSVRGNSAC